ncbi:hypothetical protein GW915_01600 [bacterium]|nr:hypothetical protein [bacterium]
MQILKKTQQQSILLFLSILLANSNVRAGLFEIPAENRDYGSLPESLHDEADLLFDALEDKINSDLPSTTNAGKYVKNVSNASVLSGTGSGTDYASPFSLGLLGFQSSVGVDLGDTKLSKISEEPERTGGFAPQFAITAGLNLEALKLATLGAIDLNKVKVYLHYFKKTFKQDELSLEAKSWGLHAQYKYIDPVSLARLVRWHGIDFTTGYRYNSIEGGTDIALSKNSVKNIDGFGETTLSFSGLADINLDIATHTIPLEVSSAIRVLYSIFAYGGAGADVSFGKSRASGSLSNSSVTASGGAGTISATGTLDIAETKKPQLASLKYFVGGGVEMGVLSVYAQWHQSLTNDTLGFALGVKGFW